MAQCDARIERSGKTRWRCKNAAVADRMYCEQHLAEALQRVHILADGRTSTAQRIPFVRKEVGVVW